MSLNYLRQTGNRLSLNSFIYQTFWKILNWFPRIILNLYILFFLSFVPSLLHRTSNFCLKLSIFLLFLHSLLLYLIFWTLTALLFFFKLSFLPYYFLFLYIIPSTCAIILKYTAFTLTNNIICWLLHV